jgi:hypothetical protein
MSDELTSPCNHLTGAALLEMLWRTTRPLPLIYNGVSNF